MICFLCRVTFQERQGLKDHLIYEHGVVFNLDFVSRVSQFRTEHARLPVIDLNKKNNNRECYKCQDAAPPRVSKNAAEFPQIAIPKIQKPVKVKPDLSKTLDETVPMPSVADESMVSEPVKVKPKNIRDKTNKYCDVCDITLDTRILFLSHCSSVHDVKFKGKSGQPLVIPSKPGEAETVASPARKKIKLADTSLNSSVDPNNPRRAPVPCKFCGKIFSNVSNKERHERQSCKVSEQFCNILHPHIGYIQNADQQQIEDKEFKCRMENCRRQFSKLGYLKKHMSMEHDQPAGNSSD